MPHPKILETLNMTPEQWGELPTEKVSTIRTDLKRQAVAKIMAQKQAEEDKRFNNRMVMLENRVAMLESLFLGSERKVTE